MNLTSNALISGIRPVAYLGKIEAEIFLAYGLIFRPLVFEKAFEELLTRIEDKAMRLTANYIVGVDMSADPFFEERGQKGILCTVSGTAARFE